MSKQVLMVISMMKGGGAERVASLLMNEFHKNGYEIEFVLTSSSSNEVVRTDLIEEIPLVLLQDECKEEAAIIRVWAKGLRICSSVVCRAFEAFKQPVPGYFAYLSFISQYGSGIKLLRQKMKDNPELTVIAFLQPSIPMTVLAGRGLPNKIIVSERGNPERLMKKRYGEKFIKRYYEGVNTAVFQTMEARATYPECVREKGVVISNPIKSDLPEPFLGVRNKNITTFCRISLQKNLPMLIQAFSMLHQEYPEYRLRIIGDALDEEGIAVKKSIEQLIKELKIEDSVDLLPFSANVHEEIVEDFMYVSSSDYEGISNAMLEAMAIGLPVVCTDCPIGGAHATIQNEVNGMLVPVGDSEAMYQAMKKVVEDKELAKQLSSNGIKLREQLSLKNITKQWMDLI